MRTGNLPALIVIVSHTPMLCRTNHVHVGSTCPPMGMALGKIGEVISGVVPIPKELKSKETTGDYS